MTELIVHSIRNVWNGYDCKDVTDWSRITYIESVDDNPAQSITENLSNDRWKQHEKGGNKMRMTN